MTFPETAISPPADNSNSNASPLPPATGRKAKKYHNARGPSAAAYPVDANGAPTNIIITTTNSGGCEEEAEVTEKALFDPNDHTQLYQYTHTIKPNEGGGGGGADDNLTRWFYYNDSLVLDCVVEYVFGARSTIKALGETVLEVADDGIHCTLTIHPGETEPFIEGAPNGYACSYRTQALSAEYVAAKRDANKAAVEAAISAVREIADEVRREGNGGGGGGDATCGAVVDEEAVLAKCVERGVQYVDLNFPPCDAANYRDGIDDPIALTTWQRPTDYLAPDVHSGIAAFTKGVEPCDIDQGALGDCYYLSALACVAERPDLVEDLFVHGAGGEAGAMAASTAAAVGAYRVSLNAGGWWETYLLDNYFPTRSNAPCYAKNREDGAELWVQLLEKAAAKANGSYSAIAGGDPLHALEDLTGYPTARLDTRLAARDEALFDRLLAWTDEGFMIALSTPYFSGGDDAAAEEEKRFAAAGLPTGHAYAVLDAVSVAAEHKLIKIRNPWGDSTEWTGRWSDDDAAWDAHPNVAAACKHVRGPKCDGTFWMAWDDVLDYFTSGGVCFTKHAWYDYRVRGVASSGFPSLSMKVTVTKRVEGFITLHQKDRRGQPAGSADADYASFVLAVSRTDVGKADKKKNGRQSVHQHSTGNCEETSPSPMFFGARDIAMRYVFEPEYSPYVITPRIYESDVVDKGFVMGLLLDTEIATVNKEGGGDTAAPPAIEVSFIDLGKKCPIFANYLGFDLPAEEASVVTEFQHNPNVGAPIVGKGCRIAL